MANNQSANVKLFYRQRFFSSTIQPLKAKFDSNNSLNESNRKILYYLALIKQRYNQVYNAIRSTNVLYDGCYKHAKLFTKHYHTAAN